MVSFSEKNLENLMSRMTADELKKAGFYGLHPNDILLRQLAIPGYGIADLIAIRYAYSEPWNIIEKRRFLIHVIELKKDKIGIRALLQASRYVRGLQHLIGEYFQDYIARVEFLFEIILVGNDIDTQSDFCFLVDTIENVSLYTYSLEGGKISFSHCSGFKSSTHIGFGSSLPFQATEIARKCIRTLIENNIYRG